MSVKTVTHLNFRGDAREALEFYQSVFGGEIKIITFRDAQSIQDPSEADQVLWGQVVADNGFHVMAYDVPSSMPWDQGKNAFLVSVTGDPGSSEEITALWEKLSDGATVSQPLAPSGWSPLYGMLKDRFGITWVLNIAAAYQES